MGVTNTPVDKSFLDGRVPPASKMNSQGETGKVLSDNENSGGLGGGMMDTASSKKGMRPRGVVRSVMGKESSKGQ